ncbi:Glycosidase [Draconibacterium orientale]|uniref:Glycosidase n=1 Tax=Draconibacterium orientale TaxID=1168034 RepID=A0A1I0JP94_9BACT|nr:alpha-amylase family glycosyl hydrolase [Draconibacterium orientale]SEU11620.1 Glycosidase [Draconibacterium orientale]
MKSINEIKLNQLTKNRTYFASPDSWEDQVLYFLMTDRFSDGKEKKENLFNRAQDFENAMNNPKRKEKWFFHSDKWNGGTLKGIKSKLNYLKELGITAIWISPVFKQVAFEPTYHGYGIQNFLEIDPNFGSREDLQELTREAHKNGMYILLDIILNHAGNVFAYTDTDRIYQNICYPVKGFRNHKGEAVLPTENIDFSTIGPDDGVYPTELMHHDTFTRKGRIINWDNYPEYIEGDFLLLKNINLGQGDYTNFQPSEALRILCQCYKYWIACADIDGFRLDTVKHLEPGATRFFVNEIHEFAYTLGKNNFYILGEITGGLNFAVDTLKKTGLDAALGINQISDKLEETAKGYADPTEFFKLFKNSELLGEDEYRWYKDNIVTMFDDHDMVSQQAIKSRFCGDTNTGKLLLNALFLNLMTPGIPCIYYGSEQCFDGSGNIDNMVREAMFACNFGAFRSQGKHFFDTDHFVYRELKKIIALRKNNITLTQGRIFVRELSNDGKRFYIPAKNNEERFQGVIAWSRVFSSDEIVLLINCSIETAQTVYVTIDAHLNSTTDVFEIIYSSDENDLLAACSVYKHDKRKSIKVTVPQHGSIALRRRTA